MKYTLSLFILAFAFSMASLSAQSEIQIRVVGGPLVDEAHAVIPLLNSTYVVGSTSSHADGTVRGYIVHYDSDFQFAWSMLTPFGSPVEQAVDAWGTVPSGSSGDLTVLSQRLGENDAYNIVLHTIKNLGTSGAIVGTIEVMHPLNQDPVSAVNWQGSRWAVGNVEGDGWLLNIDDPSSVEGASYLTWGHPVISEHVESASVHGDTLFVAGSTEIDGVLQSTVWAWGPDGSPIWARISPDTGTFGENVANDITSGPDGLVLMYTYEREDLPLGHRVMHLEVENGTPGAPVDASSDDFMEGCKIAWADNQLVSLSHVDFETGTESDMFLTWLGTYGGYINSGILGTNFADEPRDLKVDDQGRIWVLGVTHGFLNGSSSICVYRLDSIDVIPNISSVSPGLGIKNDPIFLNSVGVSSPSFHKNDLTLFPNPCSSSSSVSISHIEQDFGGLEDMVWSVFTLDGQLHKEGYSDVIDCAGLAVGAYVVLITSATQVSRLPLQIIH
ncbi:MAG: hypothetical protein CL831_03200 [Crocinitomicaceae bacterium]|nr:hypothetical protein [Crocinitomicaceae bacterium]